MRRLRVFSQMLVAVVVLSLPIATSSRHLEGDATNQTEKETSDKKDEECFRNLFLCVKTLKELEDECKKKNKQFISSINDNDIKPILQTLNADFPVLFPDEYSRRKERCEDELKDCQDKVANDCPLVVTPVPSTPGPEPPTNSPTIQSDPSTQSPSILEPTVTTTNQTYVEEVATFYAIGDVPYTDKEADKLKRQMIELPSDAEFLIHVGDLRSAEDRPKCDREEYEKVSSILQLSPVPVFVILGDNDWTDCPNIEEGWTFWMDTFLNFESRYWDHKFKIERLPGRTENFSFVHKGTLFIGLNLVGGKVHNSLEWSLRLTSEAVWTSGLIMKYIDEISPRVGRVVIFGHADPKMRHQKFFNPLKTFIQYELKDQVPILYVNGDQHEWLYEPEFFEQESFLRVMLTGGASEPPLKVTVNANGAKASTQTAFVHDRGLPEKNVRK